VRNSPSFQGSLDYGHHVIELHAWPNIAGCTFATFIYEKIPERLLRHITGTDKDEVIRQALSGARKNSPQFRGTGLAPYCKPGKPWYKSR